MASPKDYEVLSNAILDGDLEMSKLPREVQDAMASYWQVNASDDTPGQTDQSQLEALYEQRRQQKSEGVGGLPAILKPIEALGSGLYWLYSETVSPALSSAILTARKGIYGKEAEDQFEDDFWGVKDVKDVWKDAHSVSPGQAVWMLGLNNEELRKRGISPNQMAADKELVAKGKYRDTPTKNDPFGSIPAYQEYFSKGASKYVTGATDFAVSWYADPLVVTGNWAGAAKVKGFKKPVAQELEAAGKGKPAEEAFEALSSTPVFQSMVDMVGSIKSANPENAAFVLRQNMPTVAKSANGDVFARLLVQAKNEEEVSDILRITMGDALARNTLAARDVLIATQVDALSARQVLHGQYFAGLSPAKQASPFGQRVKTAIQQQEQAIARMESERGIISEKMNAFGIVENMNFNRVTTPLMTNLKGRDLARFGNAPAKLQGGGTIKASGRLVYNATIGFPIRLVRSYGDIKPSYYMDIHGETSYKELDAALKEYKGLAREEREAMVSRYISSTPAERARVLAVIENTVTRRMIDEYNLRHGTDIDRAMADELYADFAQRRMGTQAAAANRQSYGSATMADPSNPAMTIRVAEIEADGGRMVPTPIFDTQLANSHVLMDFRTMERAINTHGQTWAKTRTAMGKTWHTSGAVVDQLSTVWKFAQLARLGYAPRALADDFLGQVARFGGVAMLSRTAGGTKTLVQDMVRGRFMRTNTEQTRRQADMLDTQIGDMSRVQANLTEEIAKVQQGLKSGDLTALKADLDDVTADIATFRQDHAGLTEAAALGSQMRDVKVGREVFAGALAGSEGRLYRDLTAGQRNFANMMGGASDWYLKRMRRSNWENVTVGSAGPEKHLESWYRHVNDQIGQSSIGKKVLEGMDEGQLVRWMRTTAEGKAYRQDIGLKNISDFELAQRVKAQVDYVLDPNIPGMDILRSYAAEGKLEASMLDEVVPVANRPMINAETFKYAEGRSSVSQLLDNAISGYYHFVNQVPQTQLLRHPLFGQQYKANLTSIMARLRTQGVTHVDENLRRTMESNARKAALQDVKNFTFTMDHETKMAFHMRNFGAFFGAQQESWNRWARIISDKPQALARVAMTYGAPARAGVVVDIDGNTVDARGYVTDPATGERKLTKYGERRILIQVPEYLGGKKVNKALGLDEDSSFALPMSSFEMILNHGDGYLPVGAGPFVQIAANQFVKDNPNLNDMAKKMGLLPFGAQDSWTDFVNPNTGKKLGDSMDDYSETKQRTLFHAMQVENWKFENGLRDTEPTWDELMDRADRWSFWRTGLAFAMPFSVNAQDPYQFFRDEFDRMQKLDPNSADEKFYEKYGDSFYMFSRSMGQNNTGLKPTVDSVEMSHYYSDLISKVGEEYAGLIVGDEGDGTFSQGAYFYQKTHGLVPGSTNMQRTQLSARDAWTKGKVAQGWQDYNKLMSKANAQLFDAGFKSYQDAGAEDLALYKKAVLMLLAEPTLPDGSDNPYYNESWEKEFNSMDKGKYDRNAAKLWQVTEDPELWAKAVSPDGTVGMRSDIYTLRGYLTKRRDMTKALLIRDSEGGSADITAKSNRDLKDSWDAMVMKMIEADTKFSWVHSRWFATDMGFNRDSKYDEEEQQEMASTGATLEGKQDMFDVMEVNSLGAIQ